MRISDSGLRFALHTDRNIFHFLQASTVAFKSGVIVNTNLRKQVARTRGDTHTMTQMTYNILLFDELPLYNRLSSIDYFTT